jgi:hypothetical protein
MFGASHVTRRSIATEVAIAAWAAATFAVCTITNAFVVVPAAIDVTRRSVTLEVAFLPVPAHAIIAVTNAIRAATHPKEQRKGR